MSTDFMHDNAPSCAAKAATSFLASLGIKGESLMTWPPCSSNLKPIDQLWSILKREVYEGGQRFTSKDPLSNKIVHVATIITASQIKRLTSSVDEKLQRV
jgi:transposase